MWCLVSCGDINLRLSSYFIDFFLQYSFVFECPASFLLLSCSWKIKQTRFSATSFEDQSLNACIKNDSIVNVDGHQLKILTTTKDSAQVKGPSSTCTVKRYSLKYLVNWLWFGDVAVAPVMLANLTSVHLQYNATSTDFELHNQNPEFSIFCHLNGHSLWRNCHRTFCKTSYQLCLTCLLQLLHSSMV